MLVVILIPILKQKIRLVDFFALLIGFLGVMVISTEGNLSYMEVKNPMAVTLAVGSSFIWAFYWILNVKDKADPLIRLFLKFVFAVFFLIIGSIILFDLGTPSLEGLLGACYVGMFEMGFAYALWMMALKLSETTADVTILIYITPFISFVFVHIIVGERILFSSVMGAVLIVAGILLNKYKNGFFKR